MILLLVILWFSNEFLLWLVGGYSNVEVSDSSSDVMILRLFVETC